MAMVAMINPITGIKALLNAVFRFPNSREYFVTFDDFSNAVKINLNAAFKSVEWPKGQLQKSKLILFFWAKQG